MIDYLITQLGSNYKVITKGINRDTIEVYQKINDEINMENYFKINYIENKWDLLHGQRDKLFELGNFEKFKVGIFALYLATLSNFEGSSIDNIVKTELRSLTDDLNSANNTMRKFISSNYYSFYGNAKGSINLETASGNYNAYYLSLEGQKIPIISNRKAPSIFVVMYTYAVKLKQFEEILPKWEEEIDITITDKEKLKRVFLGK
ncbi:hypothetical protein [Virgibacillus salexigens]|uniref:Uncharacterized protein n=1 Tax=Virgibacillus kapii TaxID=1638645 RepID=A0ABQ2DY58_9BACI|nr:hypothetical protein [Virgibacillus kapii]GGJ74644.1 hypothetical protein GCM10007111_40210 [Virgibacillus kapii]